MNPTPVFATIDQLGPAVDKIAYLLHGFWHLGVYCGNITDWVTWFPLLGMFQ